MIKYGEVILLLYDVTVTEKAYAKINLFLDCERKRSDGYHDIVSVMQSVSLFDNVSVKIYENGTDRLFCNDPSVPCDERNLAYKALLAFRKYSGLEFFAEIHIDKKIPAAAGLAGGSSDAAAVLRALCTLSETGFSDEELTKIAISVGSDVPFCVFGGTKLVSSVGDNISALPKCPKMYVLLAIKGEGVSTPWAYSVLDEAYGDFGESFNAAKPRFEALLASLADGNAKDVAENAYNIFEREIGKRRGEVPRLIGIMNACDAVKSFMSGSGPTVIGFFYDEKTAKNATAKLNEYGAESFFCETV